MAFEGEDAQRWVLTDAPALAPGVDFITKSPNGPFIDTGLNVTFDMRGRMYLAVETIKEMAQVAGLFDTKNNAAQELHETAIYNAGYKAGLTEAGKLNDRITAIIDALGIAGGFEPTHFSSAQIPVEPEVTAVDTSDDIREAPVGSGSKGRKTSAATGKRGPDDISSIGDDAERFRI